MRQTEETKKRTPPRRETRIHAALAFCGRSLGHRCFLKDALCHPCTQSYLLLYFIPRSAGAAESARRFHRPNQPLFSKTSSLKRIGPGNPCQGLEPIYADLCTSPCFAFDWTRAIESRGRPSSTAEVLFFLSPLSEIVFFPSSFFILA